MDLNNFDFEGTRQAMEEIARGNSDRATIVAACGAILRDAGERPTLRDRLAMAALQGLLAQNARTDAEAWGDYAEMAEEAYGLADEMLKARGSR